MGVVLGDVAAEGDPRTPVALRPLDAELGVEALDTGFFVELPEVGMRIALTVVGAGFVESDFGREDLAPEEVDGIDLTRDKARTTSGIARTGTVGELLAWLGGELLRVVDVDDTAIRKDRIEDVEDLFHGPGVVLIARMELGEGIDDHESGFEVGHDLNEIGHVIRGIADIE